MPSLRWQRAARGGPRSVGLSTTSTSSSGRATGCETRHPLSLVTETERHDFGDVVVVRDHLPGPAEADDIATIVGDIVANTRDALDHIYGVLAPDERRAFPIFTRDPLAADAEGGVVRRWNRFEQDCRQMRTIASALVEDVQPIRRFPQFPGTDPLAVLQRMSNADKHRTLHVIVGQIREPTTVVTIPGHETQNISRFEHRGIDWAIIAWLPADAQDVEGVRVEVCCGMELVLREADMPQGHWEMPTSLENLVEYVKKAVISPLDAEVP